MTSTSNHPGEVLRREILPRLGGSVAALAGQLNLSEGMASELLQGHVAVSPAIASRLADVLGGSRADYLSAVEDFEAYH